MNSRRKMGMVIGAATFVTVLVFGAKSYCYQYRGHNVCRETFTDKETPSSTVNSGARDTTATVVDADQESVHAALVLWVQSNAGEMVRKDPFILTEFKKSGAYARFNASPAIYVNEIEPVIGFAKKGKNTWTIIDVGTGYYTAEFYDSNSIPEDLRDIGD